MLGGGVEAVGGLGTLLVLGFFFVGFFGSVSSTMIFFGGGAGAAA